MDDNDGVVVSQAAPSATFLDESARRLPHNIGRTGCCGVVFNENCNDDRADRSMKWCQSCRRADIPERDIYVAKSRMVMALTHVFTKTNKMYIGSYRCKRMLIDDKTYYVLGSAEQAAAVCKPNFFVAGEARGKPAFARVTSLASPNVDEVGDSIVCHWSVRKRRFLAQRRPRQSRKPRTVVCREHPCQASANRSCKLLLCSTHCSAVQRATNSQCSVHPADRVLPFNDGGGDNNMRSGDFYVHHGHGAHHIRGAVAMGSSASPQIPVPDEPMPMPDAAEHGNSRSGSVSMSESSSHSNSRSVSRSVSIERMQRSPQDDDVLKSERVTRNRSSSSSGFPNAFPNAFPRARAGSPPPLERETIDVSASSSPATTTTRARRRHPAAISAVARHSEAAAATDNKTIRRRLQRMNGGIGGSAAAATLKRKTPRACKSCFVAKSACDTERPCKRCRVLNKADCVDRPISASTAELPKGMSAAVSASSPAGATGKHLTSKKRQADSYDCCGLVFNSACRGTRSASQKHRWCDECIRLDVPSTDIRVEKSRIVVAISDSYIRINKMFLGDYRCKRIMIDGHIHYVLATPAQAHEVCDGSFAKAARELAGHVESDDQFRPPFVRMPFTSPNDAVICHWSKKFKRFLAEPRRGNRPNVACQRQDCPHTGNRKCKHHLCAMHCFDLQQQTTGVHTGHCPVHLARKWKKLGRNLPTESSTRSRSTSPCAQPLHEEPPPPAYCSASVSNAASVNSTALPIPIVEPPPIKFEPDSPRVSSPVTAPATAPSGTRASLQFPGFPYPGIPYPPNISDPQRAVAEAAFASAAPVIQQMGMAVQAAAAASRQQKQQQYLATLPHHHPIYQQLFLRAAMAAAAAQAAAAASAVAPQRLASAPMPTEASVAPLSPKKRPALEAVDAEPTSLKRQCRGDPRTVPQRERLPPPLDDGSIQPPPPLSPAATPRREKRRLSAIYTHDTPPEAQSPSKHRKLNPSSPAATSRRSSSSSVRPANSGDEDDDEKTASAGGAAKEESVSSVADSFGTNGSNRIFKITAVDVLSGESTQFYARPSFLHRSVKVGQSVEFYGEEKVCDPRDSSVEFVRKKRLLFQGETVESPPRVPMAASTTTAAASSNHSRYPSRQSEMRHQRVHVRG